MQIRFAKEPDVPRLAEIYAPYVTDTVVSFEYIPPSVSEFAERVRAFSAFYPYLVCEADGMVAGYAYASRHAQRAAYLYGVDVSVYIDEKYHGGGIGTALYTHLLRLLRLQGIFTAYAGICVPNEKSERLHERFGFSQCALYHKVGYKFGQWLDLAWYEKVIIPHCENPAPPKPVHEIADVDSVWEI